MKPKADPDWAPLRSMALEEKRATWYVRSLICDMMNTRKTNTADLARRVGYSEAALNNFLAGRRPMTVKLVSNLAYALGCRAETSFMCKEVLK